MVFDFAKNQTVEKLDDVPEQFRGLYVEGEEGGFKLSDSDSVKGAISAILGLNKALVAARGEARDIKGRQSVDLSPLGEWGETPEQIAESVNSRIAELTEAAEAGKGLDVEKIKKDLAKGHTKELEKANKRAEALHGQLKKVLVDGAATGAIASLDGDTELLMPFVQRHVDVREEDGEFRVYVLDEAKDVRYSGSTGRPMEIKELVSEMKSDQRYGRLFKGDAPGGGGTPPGGPGRPIQRGAEDDRTPRQKIADGLRTRERSR